MTSRQPIVLPDLCNSYALLLSVLLAQILLSCFWLIGSFELSTASYGLWTLYAQVLVLINCVTLCKVKPMLERLSAGVGAAVVIAIACASVVLLEYLVLLILPLNVNPYLLDMQTGQRVLVMLLLSILLLRLFRLLEILESRSKAEAQSRIHALQAKIQPHFLFNSLNTISELAATDAEQAENAIQALSMLFRVSLEEGEDLHSLDKELKLCDRYLELEFWRFDPPPRVSKAVDIQRPQDCLVPKLLLQPLFENALKYGIAAGLPASEATIDLSIKETSNEISIKLSNAFNTGSDLTEGHGVAINNTRERLSVLFAENHAFKVQQKDGIFHVLINLPKSFEKK